MNDVPFDLRQTFPGAFQAWFCGIDSFNSCDRAAVLGDDDAIAFVSTSARRRWHFALNSFTESVIPLMAQYTVVAILNADRL
jgi:hypothetical protein